MTVVFTMWWMCKRKDIVSHQSFHLDFLFDAERCTVQELVTVRRLWTWRWRRVAGSISSAFTPTVRSAFPLGTARSLQRICKGSFLVLMKWRLFPRHFGKKWFIQHFGWNGGGSKAVEISSYLNEDSALLPTWAVERQIEHLVSWRWTNEVGLCFWWQIHSVSICNNSKSCCFLYSFPCIFIHIFTALVFRVSSFSYSAGRHGVQGIFPLLNVHQWYFEVPYLPGKLLFLYSFLLQLYVF